MTIQTEALKLALEALTHIRPSALTSFYTIGDRDKAIIAIKEALAQPQRTWVGLTDEELREFDVDPIEAKLMIAKLKEKNT